MRDFYNDIMNVLSQYLKGILLGLGIFILVVVAIYAGAAYKVNQSSECDSCHYMAPYVRHWDNSKHADVDCIDCHEYSAGDLLLSTVKYVAGSYNPRPLATVKDDNCLSSDCHDAKMLDEKQEFTNGIMFDHSIHLNKVLRGGKLHCASCHNRMVEDNGTSSHMTVNDMSCFVCHFKDAGQGEAVTGCHSCHDMPTKEVEHSGFVFEHEPYLKLDVECKQCHISIVEGDGSVAEDKCYACHVEQSRTDYTEAEIHDVHVSKRNIDCYNCHSEIKHGNFKMVGALEIQCENCHLRQHNKPKQLYMGIGGDDSHDLPSSMFIAQVSCNGCHTHITAEGDRLAEQEKKEASRQSCVKCHGDGYDKMFDNWKEGANRVIKDYRSFLNQARADYSAAGGSKSKRQKVSAALTKAKNNLNFVIEGHIPHNIEYSLYLLNVSADEFQRAMNQINKNYKAPNKGDGVSKEKNCTIFCHGKAFFPEEVRYKKGELPHLLHVEDMELSCAACHTTAEHGKTKIDQSVCADCHE